MNRTDLYAAKLEEYNKQSKHAGFNPEDYNYETGHACTVSECGSSDALTKYFHKETKQLHRTHCFSCGKTRFSKEAKEIEKQYNPHLFTDDEEGEDAKIQHMPYAAFVQGEYIDLPERGGITKETCKKLGIHVLKDANGNPVSYVFDYFDASGTLVAQKIRDFHNKKQMRWIGNAKEAVLFGQQAFPAGGKNISIVTGEFDAAAAFQMHGSRWPVVSVKGGDTSALKELQKEQVWKWLDGFETIVLCFDADESGQKAVETIIKTRVFAFSKLKIMKMSLKDANEYLKAGMKEQFLKEFWDSSKFIPKNIVKASDMKNLALQPRENKSIAYPWDGVQDLLHGIRTGEVITLVSGTGMGKSTITRTLAHHIKENTPDDVNLGLLMLEEPVRKTVRGLMSIEMGKNLTLEEVKDGGVTVSSEDKAKAFDKLFGKDRFYLYGEFGSNFIDQIVTDVTYMAQALQCKYIFLDHISIIVAGQDNGDERKALDEIVVKLRELCHNLDICVLMVCHLKRVSGTSHEEGGQISLSDIRSSGGIAQMSDAVLGLERNQQADNPFIRNCTMIRVLKNREFGDTGPSSYLLYDKLTARVREITKEEYDMELNKGTAEEESKKGSIQVKNSLTNAPVFDTTTFNKMTG